MNTVYFIYVRVCINFSNSRQCSSMFSWLARHNITMSHTRQHLHSIFHLKELPVASANVSSTECFCPRLPKSRSLLTNPWIHSYLHRSAFCENTGKGCQLAAASQKKVSLKRWDWEAGDGSQCPQVGPSSNGCPTVSSEAFQHVEHGNNS